MKNYSYDNHIFNDNIIDKLLYTSKNNFIIKDDFYILINLPTYKLYNLYNKELSSIYDLSIDKFKYDNLIIPKLNIYKIIINKVDNNISLLSNCIFQYNNIYSFLNNILNTSINDIEIINNLLIAISKSNSSSLSLYTNINTLSKISSHILYFDNFIYKISLTINFLQNEKNEKNKKIIEKINFFKNRIISIKFFYDTINTTSIQKVSHHETNVTNILTYVATIFLPLSFIIGVFSLPIKNIPFRNNENSLYFILFIIFIICIIVSFYFIELSKRNVFN
jgi:Mg2+ and Co2+ transporter CorA